MKTIKYITNSNIIYLLSLENDNIIPNNLILNTLNLTKPQQIDILLGNLNIYKIIDNINNNIKPWNNFNKQAGIIYAYTNGTKYWYLNGKLHREDGPACEWADGHKSWYLNGKKYTKKEYNNVKHIQIIKTKN